MHLPSTIHRKFESLLNESIIETKRISGGSISHAMRINTNKTSYFLKWNTHGAPDQFRQEGIGLRALAQAQQDALQPLRIPRVIYVPSEAQSLEDNLPPFLVLEWIETGRPDTTFDERLGAGLASLHRMSSREFGFTQHTYCGVSKQDNRWRKRWEDFYAQQRIAPLVRVAHNQHGLSKGQLRTFEILIKRLPEWIATDEVPALIHGDLWYGNVLETASGPPALIDPAVSYSHREAELGMMDLFGGFNTKVWSSYQSHYPLSSGWRDRLPLYALYHVLNHFVIFGGAYGDQAYRIAKRFVGGG